MSANNDGPSTAVNEDFTHNRIEPRGTPWPHVLASPTGSLVTDRELAILRCRETPGDVMPEPGARYRSPWSRELMERNAKRAREGGR